MRSFEEIKRQRKGFPTTFFNSDKTIFINLNEIADDLLTKESCLSENTSIINLAFGVERIELGLEQLSKNMKKDSDGIKEVGRKLTILNQEIDKEIRRFRLIRMIDNAEKELTSM